MGDLKYIHFNRAPVVGSEEKYISQVLASRKLCGDGEFTRRCSEALVKSTQAKSVLLTTSCTHALEMSALLCEVMPGDEIIMPSYTFVSTADAFVLRGAKIVFVDIRPDTMNIDENLIEDAVTDKTKAIVVVHYAGVSCEMDKIMEISRKYNLKVVEDAAQGIMSTYNGKPLGTIGEFGCYSFHETKNISMGEGGALLINNASDIERAEIIREKGTNRSKFFRGEIDKYTWVDCGSSYLPSELNAAFLYAQLECAQEIYDDRMRNWDLYYKTLLPLKERGLIDLPYIPDNCVHNAHMFYIKTKDLDERTEFISFMKAHDIGCVFHYVPLHSSLAGKKFGVMSGEDVYTTAESNRLVRLPLYYGLTEEDNNRVCEEIYEFFKIEIG